MEELRLVARDSGAPTCLYCRAEVAAPLRCHRCDATYHPDCRAELGRCATPGCLAAGTRPVARPEFAQDWRATAAAPAAQPAEERPAGPVELGLWPEPWSRERYDLRDFASHVGVIATFGLLAAALLLGADRILRPIEDLGTAPFSTIFLGAILGPFVGPPALLLALRAFREPRTRHVGRVMLALLAGAAAFAVLVTGWWTAPLLVTGAAALATMGYFAAVDLR